MGYKFIIIKIFTVCVLSFLSFARCTTSISKGKQINSTDKVNYNNYSIGVSKELKGKVSILYNDSTCLLLGVKDQPFMLIAGTDYNQLTLPKDIQELTFGVRGIALGVPILPTSNEMPYILLPEWIMKRQKIEYLSLNHIILNDFSLISNFFIKYLALSDIKIKNRSNLINEFSALKTLEYIIQDNVLSIEERAALQQALPHVNIVSEVEFNKRMKKGKINLF